MNPEEKLQFLKKIPQHAQRSEEWFNQRKDKLTSSDAGTALGINPYQKPVELLYKKCGAEIKPFVGNVATLHGQKYEDEAIEHYCNATGSENHEFGLIAYDEVERSQDIHANKNYPNGIYWMAGSTDGIAYEKTPCMFNKKSCELIVLEVKCPYKREIIHGKIPGYYYPQVQLNMAILDIEKADFIEYNPPGHNNKPMELNIVRVDRDRYWFDKNVKILESFWKEVEYWREKGIINHPDYNKYHKKSKTIELDLSDWLIDDQNLKTPLEEGSQLFLDSD